jgi:hypothetical protein
MSRVRGMNVSLPEFLFNFLINFIHSFGGINPDAVVSIFKTLDNRQSLAVKSSQSLFNSSLIVVGPATSLGPLQDPIHKYLFGTIEVNQISNNYIPTHLLLKLIPVFLVTRKPVEQVPPFPIMCNCIFEQSHHNFRRYQPPLYHVTFDGVGELATLLLFLPQQVPRR